MKAEHDRRLALQHKAEREAERHQTGCLLAHPDPAEHVTDAGDDNGDRTHEIPVIYADYDALVNLGLLRPRAA